MSDLPKLFSNISLVRFWFLKIAEEQSVKVDGVFAFVRLHFYVAL